MKIFMGRYPKNPIKERTVRVQIDKHDTWSMYQTLAFVVHPMLVQLKEGKHGSPHVDDVDVPDNLKSTNAGPKEKEWDTDEFWHDRWDYVLDEIIWAFAQIIRDDRESQFFSGECDYHFVKMENSEYSKMEYGPNHTFKVDTEAQKVYEDKIQNGLNLFAKYYFCLWN